MSCLLVQCSDGFGFPEGAGQFREQGLLHWTNLWHFHLVRVRVHASILHIWSEFYMFSYQFVTCRSPLRIRPSQDGGLLWTAMRRGVASGLLFSASDAVLQSLQIVIGWCLESIRLNRRCQLSHQPALLIHGKRHRNLRSFPFRMFPLRRDLIVQLSACEPSWNDFVPCWMGYLKFLLHLSLPQMW